MTCVPTVLQFEPGGESDRAYAPSYQTPVESGEPPVTKDSKPGKEFEGLEVEASVYVTPEEVNFPNSEFGCDRTKVAKSRP